MKNKNYTPFSSYKRSRKNSQQEQNNDLTTKVNSNINQITEIYNSLYEDIFPSILCLSKTLFFEKINKNANTLTKELQTTTDLQLISKIKDDLTKKYDNDYKILSSEYQNFLKNSRNYNYLTNYRKHCAQTDNYALHYCAPKKQGKFIEIKTKNKFNRKEEVSYVICVECKQCYFSNFIFMVCVPCNKKYFSNILSENENINILPATWEKYHCCPIMNEIMKCIKCHNILYLDLTKKKLVCQNKDCNFIAKPESIVWKCFICSSEFRSKAKIYNPLEFIILKNSINLALLLKQKATPRELPCKCEKDISKLTFFHKEECKGELYKGMLIDKEIIVCSKCHAINFEEKYTWICPLCSTKFHLHSIIGCKPFSKKKYVINRRFNQSAKNLKTYIDNKDNTENRDYKDNKDNKDNRDNNINNINVYNKKDVDEKSINGKNIKHPKFKFTNDVVNKPIRKGNTYFKNDENNNHYNNNENTNKCLVNIKKVKNNYPKTADKKKKHYSTLIEILQERMNSSSKKDENENENEKSELDNSKQKFMPQKKYSHNNIRNNNYYLRYTNMTCDHTFYKKKDNYQHYLKVNLKENNISKIDRYNNDNDNDNDINNTTQEKEKKIRVNKKFHYSTKSIKVDESLNENNIKQNDILRVAESTDFSSLKTLSSQEYKSKNSFFFSLRSTTKSNPLNSYRYTIKKTNTNNSNSKELEGYSPSKLTYNQLTDNSYQDIINDLRFSTKYNMDTNSSLRISNFGNISSSNEIDSSKKYINNITEKSEEIPEINGNQNKFIYTFPKNKNDVDNNGSIIDFNNEKEKDIGFTKKSEINKNGIKDENENDISESDMSEENENQKENNNENKDETKYQFDERLLPFFSKKNVRESFNLNYDNFSQNVLISQDKLNSLISQTSIPSIQESDYTILRSIGEGTYGVVYLVQNKETYEQFALKKIVCRDYNELIKHKNELELMYSVKHENILKICGLQLKYLDETTSAIYVLMEVAQNDWNTEIKRRTLAKKYYKENEIVGLLKQIIKGFLYLQGKDIAHRDIKPQNILLFPNNIYKIADFGEAKNIKNITEQSTLRGSELYMSPVLYQGYKYNSKVITHNPYKSDVFSLGYCLLYALCLNLKVLENVRELTTMKSIKANVNKYIMKNKYSNKLMNIVYKMIDPNEDERYDFEDLSIELNEKFK